MSERATRVNGVVGGVLPPPQNHQCPNQPTILSSHQPQNVRSKGLEKRLFEVCISRPKKRESPSSVSNHRTPRKPPRSSTHSKTHLFPLLRLQWSSPFTSDSIHSHGLEYSCQLEAEPYTHLSSQSDSFVHHFNSPCVSLTLRWKR